MKNILLIGILTTVLVGCSTVVPVTQKFPAPPENAALDCDTLQTLRATPTLSEVAAATVENYGKYWACAAKVTAWQTWYDAQVKIYKELKP